MAKHTTFSFSANGNSGGSSWPKRSSIAKEKKGSRRSVSGSHPTGKVRPETLKQLALAELSADQARSKSWEEFSSGGAPQMDFVFTVATLARGRSMPDWPGHP